MHASIFSVNWFCSKSDVSPYNALGAHHAGTGGGGGGTYTYCSSQADILYRVGFTAGGGAERRLGSCVALVS